MRTILALLFMLATSAAFAQQQGIDCSPAVLCTTGGPEDTHTGDPLFLAYGKINANESQLYSMFGPNSNLKFSGTASSTDIANLFTSGSRDTLHCLGATGVLIACGGSIASIMGTNGLSGTGMSGDVTVQLATSPSPTLFSNLPIEPVWQHVGVAISDTAFATAGTTNSIALFTLAAGVIIHAIKIKHSASFAGGSISAYTLSVGVSGWLTKYAGAFDVFQAPGGTAFQMTQDFDEENNSGTTSVVITATSTGANLNAATAGSVDVWALLSSSL
jgi:hypothetical protein